LEEVCCNVCNNNETELIFFEKDKFGISQDRFNIVRCKNCGLIYINPRPTLEEIVKFYPDTYSWKETIRAGSFFTKFIRNLEKLYRYHLLNYEVRKVLQNTGLESGKILDVGCGTGDRLRVFKEKGFDTYGIEISSSARYAKDALKLNVFEGDLFKAHFPDDFFDIVTMYNVLEHLHNPAEMLGEASRILKKEGFLVIQVPNMDSLQFKLFKDRWAAIDAPRHLYYFNQDKIKEFLQKRGFKITKIDHFNNWWHPPTIVITLFPSLDPQMSWLAEKEKKGTVLKRLCWIFWTVVLPVFTFFESMIKKGAIITVYAEKQNG